MPLTSPRPLLPQAVGEEGGLCPSPPPCPFLSHAVEAEGGISGAGAISRPSSPLSRSAGEGPGVRAALTSPLPPFLSHAVGEEGGDACRVGQVFPVTARLGAG
jgi:hypothetical protein